MFDTQMWRTGVLWLSRREYGGAPPWGVERPDREASLQVEEQSTASEAHCQLLAQGAPLTWEGLLEEARPAQVTRRWPSLCVAAAAAAAAAGDGGRSAPKCRVTSSFLPSFCAQPSLPVSGSRVPSGASQRMGTRNVTECLRAVPNGQLQQEVEGARGQHLSW